MSLAQDVYKTQTVKKSKVEPVAPNYRRYINALAPFVPDASPERIYNLGRIIECFMYFDVRHMNNHDAIAYTENKLRHELGRHWREQFGHIVFTDGDYRFIKPKDKSRFNKGKSCTRELTIRDDVVKAMEQSWLKPYSEKSTGKDAITRKITRKSGQQKAMRHGRTPEQYRVKTKLPPTVMVDTYNIRLLETVYGDWLDAIENSTTPEFCADQYIELYNEIRGRSVNTHKSFDKFARVWRRAVARRRLECQTMLGKLQGDQLPQQYEQRRNKPRYQVEGIGLQNCAKWLRFAALSGQWSYDIKACHHFIMQHYARLGGIECPALDELVRDKGAFREKLHLETGLSIECVKTAVLIDSYGGRFKWSDNYDCNDKKAGLRELLGIEGQKVLADNDTFKSLSKETHRITTFIIQHHKPQQSARGGVLNAMGQMLRPANGVNLRRAQIAAFILQAIETKASLAMIDASKSARVIIHDGIVSEERENIADLEAAMLDATGIKFELDEKQIEAPDWL